MVPLLGQPGGAQRVEDMDPRVLVAFIEGILRENDENADKIDDIYADAAAGLKRVTDPAPPGQGRAADIERFLAMNRE